MMKKFLNETEEQFQHQKDIIAFETPAQRKKGIFLGTGGGKTRLALELSEGFTIVVAPKQQTLDRTWQRNADRFGIVLNLMVISKETFRRDWKILPACDTLLFDEAHHMVGATPDTKQVNKEIVPKFSQMFEAARGYIEKNRPKRFYMMSATIASKPMNVWAVATLAGHDWDFFRFREKYYIQRKAGYRSIWLPRNTVELKQRLADIVKSLGYTGRLSDWFDVPEQTHIVREIALTAEQKKRIAEVAREEADPMAKRAKIRTIENGCAYEFELRQTGAKESKMDRVTRYFESEKIREILGYAEEFPRMLVFANYTGQIQAIEKALKAKGYKVFTVTGSTKDRSRVFLDADEAKECVVICQAQIAEGYELKKPLGCVIFASKNYRFLYYDQALGRPLRADALNKNLFIHLVVKGGIDELCHKTILSGQDFQEKIYEN